MLNQHLVNGKCRGQRLRMPTGQRAAAPQPTHRLIARRSTAWQIWRRTRTFDRDNRLASSGPATASAADPGCLLVLLLLVWLLFFPSSWSVPLSIRGDSLSPFEHQVVVCR